MLFPMRPTVVLGRPLGVWVIGAFLVLTGTFYFLAAWGDARPESLGVLGHRGGGLVLAVAAAVYATTALGLWALRKWAWTCGLALVGLDFSSWVIDMILNGGSPRVFTGLIVYVLIAQYLVFQRAWFTTEPRAPGADAAPA